MSLRGSRQRGVRPWFPQGVDKSLRQSGVGHAFPPTDDPPDKGEGEEMFHASRRGSRGRVRQR